MSEVLCYKRLSLVSLYFFSVFQAIASCYTKSTTKLKETPIFQIKTQIITQIYLIPNTCISSPSVWKSEWQRLFQIPAFCRKTDHGAELKENVIL